MLLVVSVQNFAMDKQDNKTVLSRVPIKKSRSMTGLVTMNAVGLKLDNNRKIVLGIHKHGAKEDHLGERTIIIVCPECTKKN